MQFTTNKSALLLLLAIATILLAIGLVAPIITFTKFIFIHNTFSILTACWSLLIQGQYFLFVVIGLFSIVLPICKLAFLTKLVVRKSITSAYTQKTLALVHRFGKWSMLDVFVVAILVVVLKLGAIGNVEKHFGLYAYAGAAILIMILTNKIVANIEKK